MTIVTSFGAANQLTTNPGLFVAATTETTFPYIVDTSNYLADTDSVSNVTSTLSVVSSGATLGSSWRNSTAVSGNIVIINIDVSKLRLGQLYQIIVTFTANTNKVIAYTSIFKVVA